VKVKVNTEVRDKVMKRLTGERFTPKTFSITRLIQCPRKTYYMMAGTKAVIYDVSTLYMARGRGIGREIQTGFEKTEVRIERDGIRGDIDAFDERLIEIYTTNTSLSKVQKDETKVPEVFRTKVKQLMAYCYMTGVKVGDLLVFFMSGDYTRFTEVFGTNIYTGIRPELKCWTLEFTDEELEENWKNILDNKADIELALKTGSPPLTVGEEFECKSCGFNYTCLGEEPVTEPVEELK